MRCGLLVLAAWCVRARARFPGPLLARFAAILPGAAGLGAGRGSTRPAPVACLRSRSPRACRPGRRPAARTRPADGFACADLGVGQRVEPELNWTSAGFTKPMRLVLESLLRPERDITVTIEGGIVQSVSYRGRVPLLIEERVYAPLVAAALRGAGWARMLQSGRLSVYALYFTGLLVTLLALARLGLLG